MDLAQQRSQRANRQAGLDLRLETLEAQAAKLRARRDEIAAQLETLGRTEEGLRTDTATLEAAIAERRGRLEAKRHEAETKQKEVEQIGEQLARAKEEASGLESRRQLLEDLESRGEGIPAAVRRVTEAIAASGAADPLALRAGNLLVGNAENAAALEMTLVGGAAWWPTSSRSTWPTPFSSSRPSARPRSS